MTGRAPREAYMALQEVCRAYAHYPTASDRWMIEVLIVAIREGYGIKKVEEKFREDVEYVKERLPDPLPLPVYDDVEIGLEE